MLQVTKVALLLTLFIQYIEGFERVIEISESNDHDELSSDGIVTSAIGSSSGSHILENSCCIYGNCTCPSLYNALVNLNSNVLINITTDVELSSIIPLVDLTNITITGHNNPTVNCNDFGGLHFISCYNCTIEGIIWEGCGARKISNDGNVYPALQLFNSTDMTLKNCSFQHSIGQAVVMSEMSGGVNINYCNFSFNKQFEGHGTAIHYSSNNMLASSSFKIMITNCNFFYNQNAKSVVHFDQSSPKLCEYLILQNSKFHNNGGTPVYLTNQNLYMNGKIEFYRNVAENGGGIFISDYSNVTFHKSATVNFTQNTANNNGGAIFLTNHSSILFKDYPTALYQCNELHNMIGKHYLDEIFLTVTFFNNSANQFGAYVYVHSSNIIIGNTATVMFKGDRRYYSHNSLLYIEHYSAVTFEGDSIMMFYDNVVHNVIDGVMHCVLSAVNFKENATVTFCNNGEMDSGGTMYIDQSNVKFEGNSMVTFYNNTADSIGTVYIGDHSNITFEGNSTVAFDRNVGFISGTMYIDDQSNVKFKGNSAITFYYNTANRGGTIYIADHSSITFEGNSTVTFHNNTAYRGGTMYIDDISSITFEGNSTITFEYNQVYNDGGAVHSALSEVIFKGNCKVKFHNNKAKNNGGTIFTDDQSNITFEGNSTITFDVNKAVNNGGAVYSVHSRITFNGNSKVIFEENEAKSDGGAMFVVNSNMTFQGNSIVTFYNNTANTNGGAYYVHNSYVISKDFSSIMFNENTASQDGGAIYLSLSTPAVLSNFQHIDKSNITFYNNSAGYYGGAVYMPLKTSFSSDVLVYIPADIYLNGNTAWRVPNAVYLYAPNICDKNCLMHYISAITNNSGINYTNIATNPNKLILYNPAICINGSDTNCDTYYMSNVMLGQEITFDACVLDFFDQPTEATQFVITDMNHEDYRISGPTYVTISCNRTTQGISITGNLHSNSSYNYSIIISSYVINLESKILSVKLTIELSQCHPGFWYSSKLQKCECYSTNNIITCSSNSSTIKRGYWFGIVNGKPTVTLCPNDYCNFTCCEITNGIYHLSPVRANQCRPHRCGTACGNCEKGYTLSFDSPQCVDINKCSMEQTILVTILSLLYWIAVVVAVFTLTYFKVTVGSLYAIIYYYSVIDILLNPVLFISNGLYTTVNIMSSLTKLTPQFLGQLCLVRDMSGIDQQFIHYAHPAAVLFILIMISILARRSSKVSSFVSRGIIPFTCFLLLLSYTSMATTSLLLMRPLTFMDVDKVYTYISPDIEYLHGRHIAYIIPAIIFTIVIVTGFPLLLSLEPYLNSKINFIKIKPLLDQFQGCYKDKYRCFAGYYMICRLVIILLVIVKFFDDFTTKYLLISSCALMGLIHILVRPYANAVHNILDGILLQLIVIISVLPIVEIVDNYDETFVVVIAYLLVILPLTSFIAVKFWTNKNNILKSFKNLIDISKHIKGNEVATNDTQQPVKMREFEIVVDDESRRNAIVVDV